MEDLIVVGAGILGTFHAFHALRQGKRVLLFEKDQYPVQATVRNFGQIVPSGMSGRWFGYGRRGLGLYREIQAQVDISVRPNGSVYLASDPGEEQLLHELKERMLAADYECSLLSVQECHRRWPDLRHGYVREGLWFPDELSVAPEHMIYRVLAWMQEIFPAFVYRPDSAVIDVAASGGSSWVVTADGRRWEAEHVVVCNGGEFKLLFPDLFRSSGVVLSKLQMMRTVAMPRVALKGNILTGLTIRRYESFEACPSFASLKAPNRLRPLIDLGIHILFKQADDGTVIIGDSHEYADAFHTEGLDFCIRQDINELMLAEAARIVTFDVRKLEKVWAGFYPRHKEQDVLEVDPDPRIHIRTAIGGKGMTSGPGYAEESVGRILGL